MQLLGYALGYILGLIIFILLILYLIGMITDIYRLFFKNN